MQLIMSHRKVNGHGTIYLITDFIYGRNGELILQCSLAKAMQGVFVVRTSVSNIQVTAKVTVSGNKRFRDQYLSSYRLSSTK